MNKFHALLWAVQLSIFQSDFGQAKPTENGQSLVGKNGEIIDCRTIHDSYFADPDDCRFFYHCSDWAGLERKSCGTLFFHPQKRVCDWPNIVRRIRHDCPADHELPPLPATKGIDDILNIEKPDSIEVETEPPVVVGALKDGSGGYVRFVPEPNNRFRFPTEPPRKPQKNPHITNERAQKTKKKKKQKKINNEPDKPIRYLTPEEEQERRVTLKEEIERTTVPVVQLKVPPSRVLLKDIPVEEEFPSRVLLKDHPAADEEEFVTGIEEGDKQFRIVEVTADDDKRLLFSDRRVPFLINKDKSVQRGNVDEEESPLIVKSLPAREIVKSLPDKPSKKKATSTQIKSKSRPLLADPSKRPPLPVRRPPPPQRKKPKFPQNDDPALICADGQCFQPHEERRSKFISSGRGNDDLETLIRHLDVIHKDDSDSKSRIRSLLEEAKVETSIEATEGGEDSSELEATTIPPPETEEEEEKVNPLFNPERVFKFSTTPKPKINIKSTQTPFRKPNERPDILDVLKKKVEEVKEELFSDGNEEDVEDDDVSGDLGTTTESPISSDYTDIDMEEEEEIFDTEHEYLMEEMAMDIELPEVIIDEIEEEIDASTERPEATTTVGPEMTTTVGPELITTEGQSTTEAQTEEVEAMASTTEAPSTTTEIVQTTTVVVETTTSVPTTTEEPYSEPESEDDSESEPQAESEPETDSEPEAESEIDVVYEDSNSGVAVPEEAVTEVAPILAALREENSRLHRTLLKAVKDKESQSQLEQAVDTADGAVQAALLTNLNFSTSGLDILKSLIDSFNVTAVMEYVLGKEAAAASGLRQPRAEKLTQLDEDIENDVFLRGMQDLDDQIAMEGSNREEVIMQRVEHPTESPRITTDVPNLMDHWKEEFGDEKDLSSTEGQILSTEGQTTEFVQIVLPQGYETTTKKLVKEDEKVFIQEPSERRRTTTRAPATTRIIPSLPNQKVEISNQESSEEVEEEESAEVTTASPIPSEKPEEKNPVVRQIFKNRFRTSHSFPRPPISSIINQKSVAQSQEILRNKFNPSFRLLNRHNKKNSTSVIDFRKLEEDTDDSKRPQSAKPNPARLDVMKLADKRKQLFKSRPKPTTSRPPAVPVKPVSFKRNGSALSASSGGHGSSSTRFPFLRPKKSQLSSIQEKLKEKIYTASHNIEYKDASRFRGAASSILNKRKNAESTTSAAVASTSSTQSTPKLSIRCRILKGAC